MSVNTRIMSGMGCKEAQEYTQIGIEKDVMISMLTNSNQRFLCNSYRKKHKPRRRKVFSHFFKAHTGSLLLILGAYITVIFVACTILVLSVFRLENLTENNSLRLNNVGHEQNKTTGDYIDLRLTSKLFREFTWPYRDSSKLFNCSVLNDVKKFKYLTSGWTKSVFSFKYNGQNFALKTVNLNGNDLKTCMQDNVLKTCYEKASSKMYKEYILSRELSHTNIVKVLGWCVSNDSLLENVAIVTELCTPIDTVLLLQMSFRQRLYIMYNLMQLVEYLSSSSLGSVAINDFRRQQFVLCGTIPKLTDLDDLSVEEPRCRRDEQCSLSSLYKHLKLHNPYVDIKIECVNYVCSGYNEKQNIINLYRHFISILTIGIPPVLKDDVQLFLDKYVFSGNSRTLLQEVEHIYKKFNDLVQKNYSRSI